MTGSRSSIGSNGIHFLALVAFLTGESDFAVDARQLDDDVSPSKRSGYVEFTGTLSAETPAGTQLEITSNASGTAPTEISICGPDARCLIDETAVTGWIERRAGGWQREPLSFEIPYQSQLTHKVVAQILDTGTCALPSFDESARLHLPLLDALFDHYRRHADREALLCPIT